MLRRKTIASWMVFVVVIVALATSQATADVSIREFTLARHGVFTELTVRTPGRVLCNHFTEEPKFGKPFRVVLDLCGAVHELDRKVFEDLPPGVISRIRTSQYATAPQNVVRVVLDLTHDVTYKVATDESAIRISLVAPDEPDFAQWSYSAAPGKRAPQHPAALPEANKAVMAAASPTIERPVKPSAAELPVVEETTPPQRTSGDEIALPPNEEAFPKKSAAVGITDNNVASEGRPGRPEQPKVVEAKFGDTPAAVPSDRPPVPETPVAFAAAEPTPESTSPAESEAVENRWVMPVAQYDSPAGPAWTPPAPPTAQIVDEPGEEVALTAAAQHEPPPLASQEAEPAESTPVPADVENAPPAIGMDSPPAAEGQTVPNEVVPPKPEPEKQPLLTRLRSKFIGSPEEEKMASDQPIDSETLNRIRELAATIEDQTADIPADGAEASKRHIDREELESKIASVDPSVMESGTAFAATEESAENAEEFEGKGTPVQIDPARESVDYNRAGRRDPFDPLVEGLRSGLWTAALPRVDALRLVGILEDYDGSIALFEDMEGYGYILREGDPVKHGYLKTVADNRVVFEVDDYGWIHTVVLELRDESSHVGFDYAKDLLGE